MRQRRALRQAGRAARELDVDRILGLQLQAQLSHSFAILRRAARLDVPVAEEAGARRVVRQNRGAQQRQSSAGSVRASPRSRWS